MEEHQQDVENEPTPEMVENRPKAIDHYQVNHAITDPACREIIS